MACENVKTTCGHSLVRSSCSRDTPRLAARRLESSRKCLEILMCERNVPARFPFRELNGRFLSHGVQSPSFSTIRIYMYKKITKVRRHCRRVKASMGRSLKLDCQTDRIKIHSKKRLYTIYVIVYLHFLVPNMRLPIHTFYIVATVERSD